MILQPPLHPFQLWCRANSVPIPEAEVRFHGLTGDRRWRFDWAWPDRKVAIEVHGGLYRQGHHTRGKGFLDDREKMSHAQALGWRVFECAPTGKHPQTLCSPQLLHWLRIVL